MKENGDFIQSSFFINLKDDFNLNIKGIMHLGCHICQEAKVYEYWDVSLDNVIWVDGNIDIVNEMQKKYKNVYYGLISDSKKEVNFNISSHHQLSSSIYDFGEELKKLCPYVYEVEKRLCETTTVEDLIKENKIEIDFNFLLMDLQGAELDALKGISNELLEKIDYIYTEVEYIPLYKNQPLANDIIDYLENKNFKFINFFAEGPDGSGYAFFIRNSQ